MSKDGGGSGHPTVAAAARVSIDWGTVPGLTLRLQLPSNTIVSDMRGASAGDTLFVQLAQDATGSRTVTWPASVKWPSGTAPTLSGANKVDIVWFLFDGTFFYGFSHGLNY